MEASSGEEHPQTQMPANHPPAPPATEKRARRRARAVSSRYMITASPAGSSSPIPSSPSSSNSIDTHFASSPRLSTLPHLPLPKKHTTIHRRQLPISSSPNASDSESEHSSCFADENQPAPPPASVSRSSETSLPLGIQGKPISIQRRRAVKLFGDNAGELSIEHHAKMVVAKLNSRKPRPGTPMVYGMGRISSNAGANSTARTALLSQSFQRSMNLGAAAGRSVTANGAKSEFTTPARPNTISTEEDSGKESSEASLDNSLADLSEVEACSVSSNGGFCESPPLPGSKTRVVSDVRSSMPEADMLLNTSTRRLVDIAEDSLCRASASLCHRSLNLVLSKSVTRPPVTLRSNLGTVKTVGPCLPPQPPNAKTGADSKKGKKAEDAHLLRLLHNQYLQWRFVNAKAQVAVNALTVSAKKSLYDVSTKISELQNLVGTKRIELEQLERARATLTILEAQIPYLDEWVLIERDHSSSLSGAIKALQDASLRVPLIGNVKANTIEIAEVLDSATNMLESLSPSVERFLPKAEGLEDVISDLARVVNSERTLIVECGDLLSEAHRLQAKECSLRSHLIQLR